MSQSRIRLTDTVVFFAQLGLAEVLITEQVAMALADGSRRGR
jgi:hypothetical protein